MIEMIAVCRKMLSRFVPEQEPVGAEEDREQHEDDHEAM